MSSTVAELPAVPTDCRIEEIASPFPRSEYVPGMGGARVEHVSAVRMDGDFFGLTMRQLAWLRTKPDHPLMQPVEIVCGKPLWKAVKNEGYEQTGRLCETKLTCSRLLASHVGCDECRSAWFERERMESCRSTWLRVCPQAFRETDRQHRDFPKAQHERLKEWRGETSLFFYGPTRCGKTRLAMMLLKRALLATCSIGVLWPHKLERINPRFEREDPVEVWGIYDVLLIDDALLTAKTPQLASFLKHLITHLMDSKRRFIITSQVSGDDYIEHLKKRGEASRVDTDTAEALMGRIRECCPTEQQISFAPVEASF